MEVPAGRRMTLAMRWIIDAAAARTGNSYAEKLSAELIRCRQQPGCCST
jgi:small subunit ribosomal protein S7